MRPGERGVEGHLSAADLEGLIGGGGEGEDDLVAQRGHLESCAECQKHMELYEAQSKRLETLRGLSSQHPHPDCPDARLWLEVAAGVAEPDKADQLLGHAAVCDFCGGELKRAVQDLSSEEMPEEASAMLTAGFRRGVVNAICGEPPKGPARRLRWAWASAAAVVVVASGVGFWSFQSAPERLLAQAYTAHRTLEIQFPGAGYAPLRVEKGPGQDVEAEARLAEAEYRILRGLGNHGERPEWLELRSRLDLLRSRFDRAISTLEPVAAKEPGNLKVWADLGNAYLMRGANQGNSADLQQAVERLSRVIREEESRSPLFRMALFNRAIALEHLFLWDGAGADWKRYLELDRSSGWAREAAERLKKIEEKRKAWRERLRFFQMEPEEFVAAARQDPGLSAEPFLDQALKVWLPDPAKTRNGPAALQALARIMIERHGDYWMNDLLARGAAAPFPEAARLLAGALESNAKGDRDAGYELAVRAEGLFTKCGNDAGALRARVERVYSLRGAFRSRECLEEARGMAEKLAARRYRWAYVQTQFEKSTCSVRTGDLGSATSLLADALQSADRSAYPTLFLRGAGLEATLRVALGRYDDAAQRDREGLELFWKGAHPPIRAYQFYSDLSLIAEREKLWEFGYLATVEGLPMIHEAGIRTTEAMERYRAAFFAGKTRRTEAAVAEMRRANEILDSVASRPGTRALKMENQLLTATAFLDAGRTELARQVLDQVRGDGLEGSFFLRSSFHNVNAGVALKDGKVEEGRRELDRAKELAEQALATVRTERDRAYWKLTAGPVYRQAARLAWEHDRDPERALAVWEQYRGASIGVAAGGESAAAIREVARQYRKASVLAFAELGNILAGWLYDDRGIYSFQPELTAAEAANLCAAFQTTVSNRQSSVGEIRAQARRLYDGLILPVEKYLDPARVLLIEPDGVCGGIPFEVLSDREERFLADRFAMATSPGAGAERSLRSIDQTIRRELNAVVVDNPRLGSDVLGMYAPLTDSAREAGFLTAAFPSHVRLSGADATAGALLAALPRADIFYFGGHGASESGSGGFLLAPEAGGGTTILRAARLEPAIRRCRLAILSACSTARGERAGPFNPESLIQALWRAGVPNVLATRWNVDSRASAELIGLFLRALLSGQSPPEALRAAMGEARRTEGLEHPADWAAFHLYGVTPVSKEGGI